MILTLHCACTANDAPQLFAEIANPVPLTATPLKLSVADPRLVTVTLCAPLVEASLMLEKVRLCVLRDAYGPELTCETVMVWPSTDRCATRGAIVVLAENEKLSTPLETGPGVSQV